MAAELFPDCIREQPGHSLDLRLIVYYLIQQQGQLILKVLRQSTLGPTSVIRRHTALGTPKISQGLVLRWELESRKMRKILERETERPAESSRGVLLKATRKGRFWLCHFCLPLPLASSPGLAGQGHAQRESPLSPVAFGCKLGEPLTRSWQGIYLMLAERISYSTEQWRWLHRTGSSQLWPRAEEVTVWNPVEGAGHCSDRLGWWRQPIRFAGPGWGRGHSPPTVTAELDGHGPAVLTWAKCSTPSPPTSSSNHATDFCKWKGLLTYRDTAGGYLWTWGEIFQLTPQFREASRLP